MSDGLLAYRGKVGCRSMICTQPPPEWNWDGCFGWHCPTCEEPCSMQGHRCPERAAASS